MSTEKNGIIKDSFAQLGVPKTLLLGLQHMFAMFGATVLVPLISGLSVQVTLIGVGVGTLIFHFLAKGRVPAFLGSSFAFLVGIQAITDPVYGIYAGSGMSQAEKLQYAGGAIFVVSFVYLLMAAVIKLVGVQKVMKFIPPVVTGPVVVLIGIMLAPFAINQSATNPLLAVVAFVVVLIASVWGRGMLKVIPLFLGVVIAYFIALLLHGVGFTNLDGGAIFNFAQVAESPPVGLPNFTIARFDIIAIIIMLPFALATMVEHIGDMVVLSTICEEDFIEDKPGLPRTLMGDGLATCFSAFFGGPATTTYGENTGVIALTKIQDARVLMLAACYAIVLAFSPIFAALIYSIPAAIIGGVSFILYGMIAAVGLRTMVEAKINFNHNRNLIIVAVTFVTGLGLNFGNPISFNIGDISIPLDSLGLALATVLGILLNAILPKEESAENK
ncbi:MAG: uracil-xanthine permease [Defluviitaleaceae bacterium]|nr:uracil-xanthine permease [Defluviitaleaceae bacterium]